jgi:Holliday junction DNA helicase RuvA
VLAPDALATAILAQDKAALARADGVGPKLATRIASELKDKVGGIALGPAAAISVGEGAAAADAVSALVNLGYSRSDAFGAVAEAAKRLGEAAKIDALIRAGLQELSR